MKKKGILLLLLSSIWYVSQATTYTVNNDPLSGADFTDPQEAHDAALPGDVIIIQGTSVSWPGSIVLYGTLVVTKPLTIIGPGYFLPENGLLPLNGTIVKISSVSVLPTAAGTTIKSLEIQSAAVGGNDVTFESNLIRFINVSGFGHIFKKNYFQSDFPATTILMGAGGNHQFRNNFIGAFNSFDLSQQVLASVSAIAGSGTLYDHNTFGGGQLQMYNSQFVQNIFSINTIASTLGNTYLCNVFTDIIQVPPVDPLGNLNNTVFLEDGSNTAGVPGFALFAGGPSPDGQWILQAGSIAQNNCGLGQSGMFGGSEPYLLSGNPGTSAIEFSIEVPNCIPLGATYLPLTAFVDASVFSSVIMFTVMLSNGTIVNLPVVPEVSGFQYSLLVPIGIIDVGEYTVTVYYTLSDGTSGPLATAIFKVKGPSPNDLPLDIDLAEFFIDDDPLYNNADFAPSVQSTDAESFDITFNLAGVSPGIHTLSLRAKEPGGDFSTTLVRTLLVLGDDGTQDPPPLLERIEYYVDNDPGYNNGSALFTSGTTFNGNLNIPLLGQSLGWHRVFLRAKDITGDYGTVTWKWVYVTTEGFYRADIDGNCSVNVTDLLLLMGQFGCQSGCFANQNPESDNVVNSSDLLIFMAFFGLPGDAPSPNGGGIDVCPGPIDAMGPMN